MTSEINLKDEEIDAWMKLVDEFVKRQEKDLEFLFAQGIRILVAENPDRPISNCLWVFRTLMQDTLSLSLMSSVIKAEVGHSREKRKRLLDQSRLKP